MIKSELVPVLYRHLYGHDDEPSELATSLLEVMQHLQTNFKAQRYGWVEEHENEFANSLSKIACVNRYRNKKGFGLHFSLKANHTDDAKAEVEAMLKDMKQDEKDAKLAEERK